MSVNTLLRRIRKRLGISTDFVERRVGLAPDDLAEIEDGTRELDSSLLDALAELYGVEGADVVC